MKKFILTPAVLDVVKFTVSPSAGRTVTLDGLTAPFSGMVDWGDGAVSPLASGAALSHTYGSSASRQIAVRGVVGGFWNTSSSTGKNLVVSLDEISSRSLVTLQNTFRGCTALRTVSAAFLMPNVRNFTYTFYQNRSITSNLPPLWQMFAARPHSGCFTNCCLSLYGQYSSGCPYRQYVSAVPGLTYFQKYGQSGCPSATYHAGSSALLFVPDIYLNCGSCPNYVEHMTVGRFSFSSGCTSLNWKCSWRWNHDQCSVYYSSASPDYYSCAHFGGNCKTSGCSRIYQSGQSAYYRCTRSGGTCQETSCPYPYANETSYNNARNNGWA